MSGRPIDVAVPSSDKMPTTSRPREFPFRRAKLLKAGVLGQLSGVEKAFYQPGWPLKGDSRRQRNLSRRVTRPLVRVRLYVHPGRFAYP